MTMGGSAIASLVVIISTRHFIIVQGGAHCYPSWLVVVMNDSRMVNRGTLTPQPFLASGRPHTFGLSVLIKAVGHPPPRSRLVRSSAHVVCSCSSVVGTI